jgi:pentatricopeptide repeat protein
MKKYFFAVPVLVLFACVSKEDKVTIDYIGQQSPGLTAKEFAPGIVSTDSFEHSSPMFSPDGTVVLWNRVSRLGPDVILEMTYENKEWSEARAPSFAAKSADDYYPQFSPDGSTLYFGSRRPMPNGHRRRDMSIWTVKRNSNTWSEPVPFDSAVSTGREYAHAITKAGVLYFSSTATGETNWNIYRSESYNGKYIGRSMLPFGINSTNYEDGAFIAPDESYLIFESYRAGSAGGNDLYISFKLDDKTWSAPLNMGPKLNTPADERMAKLSPDGKYLFFGTNRDQSESSWGYDLYWIDASVIDELKNDPRAKVAIERRLGDDLLAALDMGDTDKSVLLLKQWNSKYPFDMEGTRTLVSALRKQKNFKESEKVVAGMPQEWMSNRWLMAEVGLTKFALNKDNEARTIIEQLLSHPRDLDLHYRQVLDGLAELGRHDDADVYFERMVANGNHSVDSYNRACFYAKAGDKKRAFKFLDLAVDHGFSQASQYEGDADLASLKTDPRWKALKKKLK